MGLIDRFVRDARLLGDYTRLVAPIARIKHETRTDLPDLLLTHAQRRPDHPALVSDARTVSWGQLDAESRRVSHWALSQGLTRGDVVGLLMANRPEYVVIWMGLARVGVVIALLNTHLSGERLTHCLREAGSRHLIVGAELAETCASALPGLESPPELWVQGGGGAPVAALPGARDLDAALEATGTGPVPEAARAGRKAGDPLFYIYTSGTTGMPKAARVSHLRAHAMGQACAGGQKLRADDRVYIPLPLYHSAGGVMAMVGALLVGGTAVIAPRFSTSRFWSDCVRFEATSFQYIGELCRYLLNAPESPDERRHRLRTCMGNGLRPEVWEPFQKRFGIERIVEFYGATEGNVALLNLDGSVGAVGRMPHWLRRALGVEVVRFDVETEEPVRGPDGLCQRCDFGEAGEALGRITTRTRFEGYTNEQATEKKVLRDVFRKGDAWFRTGDLIRIDSDGRLFFVDRIGDTFRWKGENVATGEVSEVVAVAPGVLEANVYGVAVAGADGRAGMAALVVGDGFDLDELSRRVNDQLASYAQPLFLRLLPEMEVTGTFKHRKVDLVKQGFDPTVVSDRLYLRDPEKRRYVPLDRALYERLQRGEVRL